MVTENKAVSTLTTRATILVLFHQWTACAIRTRLRHVKEWDQLCFLIPYERDCGEQFHYSNEEVGKII